MTRWMLPLLALIACGDKDDTPAADDTEAADDTDVEGDADADADGDSDADADGDSDADGDPGFQEHAVLTTVSSDYATGSFAEVTLDGRAVSDNLFVTSGDPVVVADGGLVFQINRFGTDTIRAYTPGEWSQPLWEIEVGDGANPQDVDVCDSKLFVSLYNRDRIAVYSVETGTLSGMVDLSAYNDSDSVGPEPVGMVEVAGRLYVALNRLNQEGGWVNEGGKVVEIRCSSQEVTNAWNVGANTQIFDAGASVKVVLGAEAWGQAPGGLWELDTSAGTLEPLLDLDAPGWQAMGVAMREDKAVIAAAASDWSSFGVLCYDFSSQELTVVETTTSYLNGVEANDRGEAWITAHWGWLDPENAVAGTHVYDIATCTSRTGANPVRTALAPTSVAFY